MKIVIIGCGKIGLALIEQLSREEHDLIAVDSDAALVEEIVNDYDVQGVAGNGASFEVLKEAHVQSADLVIATTEQDEVNILACMVAKKLGSADTIARVRNPEYFTLFMGKELGLNMMVNPEYRAAQEISSILRIPMAIKNEPFANGRAEMLELKLGKDNPLIGKQLSELGGTHKAKILVCAVKRGEEVLIPKGNFMLQEGDTVTVITEPKDSIRFFKKIGLTQAPVRSLMILGGGKTTYYLARELQKLSIRIKILESDARMAERLAEMLPHVEVVHADGTSQDVLLEEGLLSVDALVTLTDRDEANVIVSMYANSVKVPKVITSIGNLSYRKMLEQAGLECIVSPKLLTADQITTYVRGKQNSLETSVLTLYRIVDDRAEAIELLATPDFRALSTPIRNIPFASDLLIAGIMRDDVLIIPGGDDTIEPDDHVIVVTTRPLTDELNDLLLS